ncbi:MAG: WYL domain-containing protein [Proteobacteria bacterium]|nr:WYL domain-containing protein [Pseudomonadota bacterium]
MTSRELDFPPEIVFLVRRVVRFGRATRAELKEFFPAPPATLSRLTSRASTVAGIERRGAGRSAYLAPSGDTPPTWASFEHLMHEVVNGNDPRTTGLREDELPVFIPNWVSNAPIDPNALPFIVRALAHRTPFRLCYVGTRQGSDAAWRNVYPSGLERMGDQWRLIAADLDNAKDNFPLRTFVLARIVGVAKADKSCRIPRSGFSRPGVHDCELSLTAKFNPALAPDQVMILLNELRVRDGTIKLHGRSAFEFLRRFGAQKPSADAVWPPLLNNLDDLAP